MKARSASHWISALAAGAAVSLSAPANAQVSHEKQVERALFDICPQVLSGELDLSDPGKIGPLGYRVPERDFKRPAAELGTGKTTVLILGPSDTEFACSVIFAAPQAALFHKLEASARKRGFDGPQYTALSRTLRFVNLQTQGEASLRFSMFDIDAAGGVDFRPLLTAGLAPADGATP